MREQLRYAPTLSENVAAASLLCVAFGNPSIAGSAFLLLFLVWALVCVPYAGSQRGIAASKAVWGAAAAISAMAFTLSIGVQFAFFIRTPGIGHQTIAKILDILGFSHIVTLQDALFEVGPLVVAVAATGHQAAVIARSPGAAGSDQRVNRPFSKQQIMKNVFMLCMLGAAFCHPALLSLPYVLALAVVLHHWSCCTPSTTAHTPSTTAHTSTSTRYTAWMPTLQLYCAAHLALLWAWQWMHTTSLHHITEDVLGLFVLDYDTQSGVEYAVDAAVFVCLAGLIAVLGATRSAATTSSTFSSFSDDEGNEMAVSGGGGSAREPLLHQHQHEGEGEEETMEQQQHHRHHHHHEHVWGLLIKSAVSSITCSLEYAWLTLFSRPQTVALVLCAISLLRPSLFGGLLLVVALAVLLLNKSTSHAHERIVFWAMVVWLSACYVVTALHVSMPLGEAIGVHAFSNGAPLLAIFTSFSTVATSLHRSRSSVGALQEENHHFVYSLQAMLGSCALPFAVFVVGVLQYDLIHLMVLLILVVSLLSTTLQLKPNFGATEAVVGYAHHNHHPISPSRSSLLQIYVAAALVALYTVYVGGLEVFHHVLQPERAQHILTAVGLWQPRVVKDILPFAALLVSASFARSDGHNASASRSPSPPMAWLLFISKKCSTYGASLISIALYCIVLLDCDVAAVGLMYVCLAVWCLAVQPKKGYWLLSSSSQHTNNSPTRMVLQGSSAVCWMPLTCTAAVAAVDFFFQAALPAVVMTHWPFHLSLEDVDFLRSAVGIDAEATGMQLALCLLRPVALLLCIDLYRRLYCIGTYQREHAAAAAAGDEDEEVERHRLVKQWTFGAFAKRLVILHASKVMAVVAFAAAMQIPSALGAAIVVGVAVLPSFLGPHRSSLSSLSSTTRMHRVILSCTHTLASLWLFAQFSVQIPWIQSQLLDTSLIDVLLWVGIDASSTAATTKLELEVLLRYKVMILAAVALNRRSLLWCAKLPEAVRREGQQRFGAVCPLFWPPFPGYHHPLTRNTLVTNTTTTNTTTGGADYDGLSTTARDALHSVAQRARTLAQQALLAVDWPSPLSLEQHNSNNEDRTHEQPATTTTAISFSITQLTAFRFAVQEWAERCFMDWGLEIAMFSLLIAAFTTANALSLVYMIAVALGMIAPVHARSKLWKWAVMPILGCSLVWQYATLVGWPPREHEDTSPTPTSSNLLFVIFSKKRAPGGGGGDVRVWLGLEAVDPAAVWALFFAFGTTVLQIYSSDRQSNSNAVLQSSFHYTATATTAMCEPLLAAAANDRACATGNVEVWAPLQYSAQSSWRWHDWLRYNLYRRSLDFLLIAVVALCTVDNDIIHAGYLALALFFFRSRVVLRVRRNNLFSWLPLYNFAVMVTVLAYQAPFEDVWDWPLDDGKSCTLAHLLGLYKLHSSANCSTASRSTFYTSSSSSSSSSLMSWGYEGAVADLILWVFIRLQTHMFASPTFSQVIAVAEREEEKERAARKLEIAEWKQQQAAAAVGESRQRAARALRISRIKQGVDRSLSLFGSGVSPTVLDFAFLESDGTTNDDDGGSNTTTTNTIKDGEDQSREEQLGNEFTYKSGGSINDGVMRSRRRGGAVETDRRRDTAYEAETVAPLSSSPPPSSEDQHAAAPSSSNNLLAGPSSSSTTTKLEKSQENATILHNNNNNNNNTTIIRTMLHWMCSLLPRRADRRESALAYALFVFAYLFDLSLLTLALPLSAFVYSLVAVRPARLYWHLVLIYCEAAIVASYAFQVPARLNCVFISLDLEHTAEMLGIHVNAARCIPLFLVYLATLRHTHGLLTRHAAGQRAAAAAAAATTADTCPNTTSSTAAAGASSTTTITTTTGTNADPHSVDLEIGSHALDGNEDIMIEEDYERDQVIDHRQSNTPTSATQTISVGLYLKNMISRGTAALCEFILTAISTACERPPAFLLVEVLFLNTTTTEDDDDGAMMMRDGAAIEQVLQQMLDSKRERDVAQERHHRPKSSRSSSLLLLNADNWQGGGASGGGHGSHALDTAHENYYTQETSSSSSLSAFGPLQLQFHSFLEDETVVLPLKKTNKECREGTPSSKRQHVLLEVIALQSTPENTPGVCSSPGWPLRCLQPAAAASDALVTTTTQHNPRSSASPPQSPPRIIEVVSAETHGRQSLDFYAATAVLDFIALSFVAVYYNRVVHGAGSISEITSQHVVPLGYLVTLMVLFMFVVMDRVVYTLGSAAGKAALHVMEMTLFFWYCSTLVWAMPSAATGPPPRDHLRILLALKSASFALSALQLRTGYPPPASYANGMGRHTFVFMRSVSIPSSVLFHIFAAIPFLYEMRQLLDWACTATTLTLYDWLKLEDINMSLYFSAVMRESKMRKPLGARQPRYLKFFQGTLLFSLLLVLLWVPLLVFSTGNPTYQVPSLATFSVNVTLQATSGSDGGGGGFGRVTVPLFHAGNRGVWSSWIQAPANASSSSSAAKSAALPAALAVDYSPEQLQLLCTPPDADALWAASPPTRRALVDAMDSPDADVAISFGWDALRDLPPPSDHGGPLCTGTAAVALADESRVALIAMMRGERTTAPLLRRLYNDDDDDDSTHKEKNNSTSAFHSVFWLLRGDACAARPLAQEDIRGAEALPGRRLPVDWSWADRWLACNVSLESVDNTNRNINEGGGGRVNDMAAWWQLQCGIVDSAGTPIDQDNDENQQQQWPVRCRGDQSDTIFTGPRIVAVLDRVQGGIIGATLTKFGVIGLYSVFVLGIGRFLRLSITNLRMRIPFEDLPTTRRLVSLCQDIYIARAEGLLGLEEELYAALLAVYRLPAVMYELTKKRR